MSQKGRPRENQSHGRELCLFPQFTRAGLAVTLASLSSSPRKTAHAHEFVATFTRKFVMTSDDSKPHKYPRFCSCSCGIGVFVSARVVYPAANPHKRAWHKDSLVATCQPYPRGDVSAPYEHSLHAVGRA